MRHDLCTGGLVAVEFELFNRVDAANQGHAAAGNNAFFNRRTGGVQGVFDTGFLFFHFRFAAGTDVDLCHAAGQFGQPLLQFFTVIIAGGGVDLGANLVDAAFDVRLAADAFDDDGVVVVDGDFLGLTQLCQLDLVQFDTQILKDRLSTGQHGDVFEHGLAAVAVTGGLDRTDVQNAAQFIDNQCRQCLAFDVFGDNQQRAFALGGRFQQRHEFLDIADLIFEDQYIGLFQFAGHCVLVRHKVRRQVPAIKLHPLDVFDGGV